LSNNVVISSSSGLKFDKGERIFFNSLRTHYRGAVYVFTNNLPNDKFLQNAKKYNFVIVPYIGYVHPCVDRNFHTYQFLQEKRFDKICVADLPDTLWQTNPFDFDESLEFSYEFEKFRENWINQEWIRKMYSEEVLSRFLMNYIVCAGAYRGSYESILKYLKFQTEELSGVVENLDQAIHNKYVYDVLNIKHPDPDKCLIPTVGYTKSFTFDTNGNFLNSDNKVCALLHQYIHHPILRLVAEKYESINTCYDQRIN